MTDNMKKAIEKIDAEAEKAGNNGKMIAQHIIDELITTDYNAVMILDGSKTLEGCVDAITDKAKGQKEGSVAVIEDKQVWAWVRRYYGIGDVQATAAPHGVGINLADYL